VTTDIYKVDRNGQHLFLQDTKHLQITFYLEQNL